jgi:hypothetical protein
METLPEWYEMIWYCELEDWKRILMYDWLREDRDDIVNLKIIPHSPEELDIIKHSTVVDVQRQVCDQINFILFNYWLED